MSCSIQNRRMRNSGVRNSNLHCGCVRKTHHFLWQAIAALVLACLATQATAVTLSQIQQRGYMRVAVANEQPYGYVDAQGHAQGFGPATAVPVLNAMGIVSIQWVVMPFDRLIAAVNSGRVDMVAAGQAILPRRCDKVLFSRPNTSYGEGLLVLAGNPLSLRSYANVAANPQVKLGVVAGASEAGFAQSAGIGVDQIVVLTSNQDAVAALLAHKIDAYAATQFTVAGLAADHARVAAAKPYPKKPFALNPFKDPIARHKLRSWGAFTFAKDSRALRDRFDQQLAAFQKTDKWPALLRHYGLDQRSIDAIDKKTTQQLCAIH